MMPVKMADCCVIKSEANVNPMIMRTYLARSPISIFRATKFICYYHRHFCWSDYTRITNLEPHFVRNRRQLHSNKNTHVPRRHLDNSLLFKIDVRWTE
jgi:hypothetical protein